MPSRAIAAAGWLPVLVLVALVVAAGCRPSPDRSVRFSGTGAGDIDRVKIPIDDPATTAPGPPADVGATDFTLEFFLRAPVGENTATGVGCGGLNYWINGNIVVDRDRFNQPRNYGISLGDGQVRFGVMGEFGDAVTLCGTTDLRDDAWHHVAVQRRRSDGFLWIYVDGVLEASGDGPDGDISYPDDGVPGNYCGGPCDWSDPFIVLGAEKHDAGPAYPSFTGWLDELRISTTLRYGASFPIPDAPFLPDADTAALFHLNRADDLVRDASGAAGGPSDGFLAVGGVPEAPVRSLESPFAP